jgi:hypothetical protein
VYGRRRRPLKECPAGADHDAVEEGGEMSRALKLTALVSLIAYAGGAAAVLWRRS